MNISNEDAKIAAIDRLLAADPRNVRGLIQKADHFAASGDARSASAFYLAAVRAAPPREKIPPELVPDLRRAQEMCARYAAQYKDYLRGQLAAKGFDASRSSARFAQSLDIVLGEKRIYVQEPRYYYFPGLPQIQFYESALFPWLADVESATDSIRAELLEVMRDPGAFSPYVTGDPNRPRKDQQGMLNNPAWSAYYSVEKRRIRRGKRRALPAHSARPAQCAARDGPEPLAVHTFFAAQAGRAHSAPQRAGEHPADLPPAAHRARPMPVPRRQRRAAVDGRQRLGLR